MLILHLNANLGWAAFAKCWNLEPKTYTLEAMKMVILYHPQSEHGRKVEEFAHDFERVHRVEPELLSLETKEGADKARAYGVVRYPTIIVSRDDGAHMKQWEGVPLPLMNEVAGYLHR